MSLKHELQSIISGNGSVRNGKSIQTITGYLRGKKKAVSGTEKAKLIKEQETKILVEFIEENRLWYTGIDKSKYIGEGAEQKIYEFSDTNFILKLNDSIFYALWEDYLYNLLIHNYFFPHLAYELLGFYKGEDKLYSVVKQPFVRSTESTNLENVKEFLATNGFLNKKENDYYHPGLGIILEDLHDENVLTEEGTLQFIDTVFFLTPSFYDKE
ncbi:MAG TPA: hypothetical protein VN026_09355 [Bacteroidia bacterium]|jgi:hypothetical protein|nr:hypothetical protein [Bacteroidia bacterium]